MCSTYKPSSSESDVSLRIHLMWFYCQKSAENETKHGNCFRKKYADGDVLPMIYEAIVTVSGVVKMM